MKGHQKSAMAFQGLHLLDFLVRFSIAITMAVTSVAVAPGSDTALFNRTKFPAGFIFGAASSSYQYEGAAFESGRGPSTWDNFTHKYPEKITDHSTGDVAVDSYHRYKEDIRILKDMNMDAYRFSISWTRVLPNGKLSEGVNEEGVAYYNSLINGLLANGLRPYVTIFHWDFPQALEEEYGGFLSPKSVDHFRDYAELCFKRFGDRVKHWITLNEPWSYSRNGYATGSMAPGHCSAWQQRNCTGGNSGTEPYLATHYQILAHGAAVKLYKEKYQASQKGIIGITLNTYWYIPMFETKDDHDAAQRAVDFMFGWYMDPLASGDYPPSMRSLVGDRLPHFTKEESTMLKGSFDFLGLNYYSAYYAANLPVSNNTNPSYLTDYHANLTAERNGIPIGPRGASKWLYVYPKGIKDLLLYIKSTYNNPHVYITENGINEENDPKLPLVKALADNKRIEYHARHLAYLLKAIKHGVKVKGYFAWSLLDNFEWYSGYSVRFGFYYIDYSDGLKRYPKLSALWFRNFLRGTR